MVDDIFINLEFMEFCVDFAETGRMSFLSTLVASNGFKVKRFFGFRLGRFMRFRKLFIWFFVVSLFRFEIELFTVFVG
jgi:hypothetical protein